MPIAIVLFVGALLVGIGSVTKSWFAMSEHDASAHAGLFSYEFCEEDHCDSETYIKELKHAHGRQLVATAAGLGATAAGIAVAVLGILGGVFLLGGRPRRVVSLLAVLGAAVALFLAIVFMVAMDAKGLSIGYGVFLFFIGGIGSLVAGILAMGKTGPAMGMAAMQPPYQGAAMPMQSGGMPPMQHMQPPCPNCRHALQFVPQYQRWFCAACNRYV